MVEFDHFRKEAGLPTFVLSVGQWVEKTNAIGLVAKSGKYGGTYAHKDIAFEFGSAISPVFKLYLIKEYQKLKEKESNHLNLEWNVKRILSKANYHIQTEAIKNNIIPAKVVDSNKQWLVYAEEADLLNVAVFGCTAKELREANRDIPLEIQNIRDEASINELTVLANLESLNSVLIQNGVSKTERFYILSKTAEEQLEVLKKYDSLKSIKKQGEQHYIDAINKGKNPTLGD